MVGVLVPFSQIISLSFHQVDRKYACNHYDNQTKLKLVLSQFHKVYVYISEIDRQIMFFFLFISLDVCVCLAVWLCIEVEFKQPTCTSRFLPIVPGRFLGAWDRRSRGPLFILPVALLDRIWD